MSAIHHLLSSTLVCGMIVSYDSTALYLQMEEVCVYSIGGPRPQCQLGKKGAGPGPSEKSNGQAENLNGC
jgi:hypothetical protein